MKDQQASGIRLICLALIIIVATVVITGCLESTPDQKDRMTATIDDPREQPAAAGTTVMTTATTAPAPLKTAQTTPAPVFSHGITLDPVGDIYDGKEYLITGTTSLPVGTALILQFMPDTGTPPNGTVREAIGGGAGSTAWITEGDGGVNRIRIQGSVIGQPPGKWVALVGEMKGTYSDFQVGDHYGYAYYTFR